MAEEDETLDRALAHHQSGQLEQAAELYRQVLRINPDKADGLYLFGCLAYQTGNTETARDLLQRAVGIAPEQAEYHHALALVLSALAHHDDAVESYRRVTELAPRHERAWYGWGCEEIARSEFATARNCFERALEQQPEWLEARHNLARCLYELGMVSEAFGQFKICSEMDHAESAQSRAMLAVIVPGVPEADHAEVLETRKRWVGENPVRAKKVIRCQTPLRVAYVSSFFQRDNWMKPVWGLINQHDRAAVQVTLLSDCAAAEIKHGYRPHGDDRYFDTSRLSNGELAAFVEESVIDVVVDLNGYSNMRRLPLFAQGMSAIVIGWFNMYATTGMEAFDYLIGDSEVVLAGEEPFYSEKILRVRGSYLTFDVSYPVPPVVTRSESQGFVFGALASQYKITNEVIAAWSRILRETPGSSLLLKNKQMASASGREVLIERFGRHGVGRERLQLEVAEPHVEFLRAYERMDLALDPFPYNGGTTTTEAIWQGVPVVTFYGDRWASRTSASILRAGGLGEFVAGNIDGYVELAVRLAQGERTRLGEMRLDMRARLMRSAVCNTAGFARQMEELYRQSRGLQFAGAV